MGVKVTVHSPTVIQVVIDKDYGSSSITITGATKQELLDALTNAVVIDKDKIFKVNGCTNPPDSFELQAFYNGEKTIFLRAYTDEELVAAKAIMVKQGYTEE